MSGRSVDSGLDTPGNVCECSSVLFLEFAEEVDRVHPVWGDMFIDRRRIKTSHAVRRGGTKLDGTTQLDSAPSHGAGGWKSSGL